MMLCIDGHINHSPGEIKQMVDDIINGIKYKVATPNMIELKKKYNDE